jgi:hypothetical protein
MGSSSNPKLCHVQHNILVKRILKKRVELSFYLKKGLQRTHKELVLIAVCNSKPHEQVAAF